MPLYVIVHLVYEWLHWGINFVEIHGLLVLKRSHYFSYYVEQHYFLKNFSGSGWMGGGGGVEIGFSWVSETKVLFDIV